MPQRPTHEGWYLLDKKPSCSPERFEMIHNNLSDRMASCWRLLIQISALSTFDGRVLVYHGVDG